MDGAPEALKQEQEKILTCKKKQWKIEAEIYKLAALYMRLDLGVLITDRGWRVRARIVKIFKDCWRAA